MNKFTLTEIEYLIENWFLVAKRKTRNEEIINFLSFEKQNLMQLFKENK